MTGSTAPNASTAQARVIIDELARSGVLHLIVCPGSRSAALAIAADGEPRLRVHVHPDERSAAFVALGIGRATGVPAAVVVTSGTAVANLHPATVEADLGGVPLLLVSADRPPEQRDTGANQTIQHRGLLEPGLRWAHEVGVAEDRPDAVASWRAATARAVATASGALGGMPGPVHLNVPTREPTVPFTDDGRTAGSPFASSLDGRPDGAPWVRVRGHDRIAPPAAVEEMSERIAAVTRGLIVVGGEVGTGSGPSAAEIDALAVATGWPVLAEGHSPVRHGESALRAGSWLAGQPRFAPVARPELILRFGRPTVQTTWGRMTGQHEILVDRHGGWHDPRRAMTELIVADPATLVSSVSARLGPAGPTDWGEMWRAADAAAAGAVDGVLDGSSAPTGLGVASDVLREAPSGARLVIGSSLPIRDVDLATTRRPDLHLLANRGAAGIDGTVSTALGAGLGSGEPVWALVGDQTFLHDANGPLLQPRDGQVPLRLVVVDNGGGRIFDSLPASRHRPGFERLFTAPPDRDLAALAGLHGYRVVTVADRAELREALREQRTESVRGDVIIVRVDGGTDLAARRRCADSVSQAIAPTLASLARTDSRADA